MIIHDSSLYKTYLNIKVIFAIVLIAMVFNCKFTEKNRNEERMNLKSKVYITDAPSATSDTARSEFFSGSLGLLNGNGPSCNVTDAEASLEMAEMLRRKKKRKRGMRL